jgi:NAD(P)-dependent dehydrogenase (short-subunit alcohol dehydrogenase family)
MKLQSGDVAVVTGAGSGIGFALAERFARAGMQIVAADVDDDSLADAADRLRAHGVEVLPVRTDVSKEDEVNALAAATLERFGGVHVVCNNAGVAPRTDPWFGPISTWKWVVGVNLWGVIHGIRAFLPHLLAGGRGHIVNTASMAGLFPGFGPSYDGTKHAVVAISEDLYLEMTTAGFPVGVSVLCPGWVRTQIMDADRNWPVDEHGARPEPAITSEVVIGHARRAIAEGLTPAAVAELVATCVEEDRFWVLPNPDWVEIAAQRWDTITEGANPTRPEQLPGMPPTAQIFAEAVEALTNATQQS